MWSVPYLHQRHTAFDLLISKLYNCQIRPSWLWFTDVLALRLIRVGPYTSVNFGFGQGYWDKWCLFVEFTCKPGQLCYRSCNAMQIMGLFYFYLSPHNAFTVNVEIFAWGNNHVWNHGIVFFAKFFPPENITHVTLWRKYKWKGLVIIFAKFSPGENIHALSIWRLLQRFVLSVRPSVRLRLQTSHLVKTIYLETIIV